MHAAHERRRSLDLRDPAKTPDGLGQPGVDEKLEDVRDCEVERTDSTSEMPTFP